MDSEGLFIVLEGLDGSGKSTAAEELRQILEQQYKKEVRLTCEPTSLFCGGKFIRKILRKEITDFSHETLMLAFAANRMDHNDRHINPWLAGGPQKVVISDRYYLSSLVYQSNDNYPMADVMQLNRHARRPDVTFFLEVDDAVCQERMGIRNQPLEYFEDQLPQMRKKYQKAISFLQERGENIIRINANGTVTEVRDAILGHLGVYVKR